MNGQEKQLVQDFIREKLDGKIGNFAAFDFKSLNGSDQFGCPGRRFDSDDTEIMRAVYVLLWGDELPELTLDTLGTTGKYRGDTMNSFHTMFGREIEGQPGFYGGLEKFHPSDRMRERVREFGSRFCSTLGNYAVLPQLFAQETTLNFYRGTNDWRDFFDRFLIQLHRVLCGEKNQDPLLAELVRVNSFCFDRFQGESGFRSWIKLMFLDDYCNADGTPKIVFPLNYHWKNPADPERYLADVTAYLDRAEAIIAARGRKILAVLESKL